MPCCVSLWAGRAANGSETSRLRAEVLPAGARPPVARRARPGTRGDGLGLYLPRRKVSRHTAHCDARPSGLASTQSAWVRDGTVFINESLPGNLTVRWRYLSPVMATAESVARADPPVWRRGAVDAQTWETKFGTMGHCAPGKAVREPLAESGSLSLTVPPEARNRALGEESFLRDMKGFPPYDLSSGPYPSRLASLPCVCGTPVRLVNCAGRNRRTELIASFRLSIVRSRGLADGVNCIPSIRCWSVGMPTLLLTVAPSSLSRESRCEDTELTKVRARPPLTFLNCDLRGKPAPRGFPLATSPL